MARDSGEVRRVEVGFSGGQVILMRLSEKAYEQLRRAAQEGVRRAEDVAERVLALGALVRRETRDGTSFAWSD